MSDEEEQEDTYIRHPPLYRSSLLSQFIEKLECRYEKRESSTNHPRKRRVLGTPVDVPIPAEAKKWMIKPRDVQSTSTLDDIQNTEQNISQSEDEGSDSSGSEELFSD